MSSKSLFVLFALLVAVVLLSGCSVAQCYDSTGMATTCLYDAVKNPAQSHAVVYGEVEDKGIDGVSCSADLRVVVGNTYTCKSVIDNCEKSSKLHVYAVIDSSNENNVTAFACLPMQMSGSTLVTYSK